MGVPLQRWSGEGELTLLCAHATGFCKETWEPFVDELRAAGGFWPVLGLDFRSHGAAAKLHPPVDWWTFAEDVAAAVADVEGPVAGIGHSMGAVALLMHEILNPGTFVRLVLVEPIVIPAEQRERFRDDNPLARIAGRRRPTFASPAEARANFASKPVFARWDERALDGYIRGGLVQTDGDWSLACVPIDEAATFEGAGSVELWDRLGEIRCPVLVVGGEHSDSHPRKFIEDIARQFPEGRSAFVAGATHLVPMEEPAALARVVLAELTA
ncbi:MAG: alpha/beta hydrolase [Acidimicrobiia bacterium]|nr:alpha/beta hydrolase [Acidimicrobiia bacterium]